MTKSIHRPLDPNDERPMHINRRQQLGDTGHEGTLADDSANDVEEPQSSIDNFGTASGNLLDLEESVVTTQQQSSASEKTGTKPKQTLGKKRGTRGGGTSNNFVPRITRSSARNLNRLVEDESGFDNQANREIDTDLRREIRRSLERGANNPVIGVSGVVIDHDLDETRSEAGLEPRVRPAGRTYTQTQNVLFELRSRNHDVRRRVDDHDTRIQRLEELRQLVNSIESRTNDRLGAHTARLDQIDVDLVEMSKRIYDREEEDMKVSENVEYAIGLAETCDKAISSLNSEHLRFEQRLNREKEELTNLIKRRTVNQPGEGRATTIISGRDKTIQLKDDVTCRVNDSIDGDLAVGIVNKLAGSVSGTRGIGIGEAENDTMSADRTKEACEAELISSKTAIRNSFTESEFVDPRSEEIPETTLNELRQICELHVSEIQTGIITESNTDEEIMQINPDELTDEQIWEKLKPIRVLNEQQRMPSPHDIERRLRFKQILRERRRMNTERVEAEWVRLREQEAQRDEWARGEIRARQRAEEQAQREESIRLEEARRIRIQEEEKREFERKERERQAERDRRRAHVEALPQDPVHQRRQRYESMGFNIKRSHS
ncbi:hypothetical protein QAD02_004502 [Eretmocerus hayati]|uniref:Uncharacterized protein n=1 Tax=Eretmocerus hayati TaxID=131215 RepID=A0ACC2NPR4_9HYME|nr:hypothetical protein QAD02_004502 [Eretmocerus hayati]